jgi:hypothetical protein
VVDRDRHRRGGEDQFGATALVTAVERDSLSCARILLRAGAEIEREHNGWTALHSARSRELAMELLTAGADPQRLSEEGRRALLGLPPDPDVDLLEATPAEFRAGRERRFGTRNPSRSPSRSGRA